MKKAFAMICMTAAAAGFSGGALAAPSEAKLAYTEASQRAEIDYQAARPKCDGLTGNPKDVCIAEAKAARIHVEANAKAQFKNTLSARTKARKTIADADYDVNKAKCGSQTGNARDVCIKEAKATKIAFVADATADKKVVEARKDARQDKKSAEYDVALEKCDALAGSAKDTCVAEANRDFGK